MVRIPSKGTSLWVETAPRATYAPLSGNLNVDIAVIGAGIAGLTTAYLLKQRGKQVAVFDKWQVGGDISGFTTGKVTSQHGITYSELIKKFGSQTAKLYGKANQEAIKLIEDIIATERIECGWRRTDNYVFTEKPDEVEKFRQEAVDAKKLGLPASFETTVPLPFATAGGVRFKNQATFHIGRYLQGLAAAIEGGGCHVYENTKVTNVRDGKQCHFSTPGGTVTANAVLLATNIPSPLITHTAYGFKAYPTRSYIVAGRTDRDIDAMYITAGNPTRSILPVELDGKRWLLVGGEGHFAGMSGPASRHWQKLSEYAQERFGVTTEYQWSTWDYVAYDRLPLIGKAYSWSKNTYVATGFRKWGLSNGTVAGMVLADTLTGRPNRYAHVLRSTRGSAITQLPQGLWRGLTSH